MVKDRSNFFLFFFFLHVVIQFFQHHLLKKLSFPHWVFLTSLSNPDCICRALNAVSLIYVSCSYASTNCLNYYSFVVQLEVRKCDASGFVLSQNCFGYLETFVNLWTFRCSMFFSLHIWDNVVKWTDSQNFSSQGT